MPVVEIVSLAVSATLPFNFMLAGWSSICAPPTAKARLVFASIEIFVPRSSTCFCEARFASVATSMLLFGDAYELFPFALRIICPPIVTARYAPTWSVIAPSGVSVIFAPPIVSM